MLRKSTGQKNGLARSPGEKRGAFFLFALSLAGLWLGQRGNGGFRAVIHDIQLMMIAPLWLLSVLYKRLGIPY